MVLLLTNLNKMYYDEFKQKQNHIEKMIEAFVNPIKDQEFIKK